MAKNRSAATMVVLALVVAACSSGGEGGTTVTSAGDGSTVTSSDGTTTTQGSEPLVLEFPTWQADEPGSGEFYKGVAAEVEANNPGVTVDVVFSPFEGHDDNMVLRIGAGDPPDIVHVQASNVVALAAEGVLEPLDGFDGASDIFDAWTPLQSDMQFEGQNHALLVMGFPWLLFYNEQLLNDNGVGVPTTVTELLTAIRAFDDIPDVEGFVTATASDSGTHSQINPWIVGNGASWVADGIVTADSQSTIDAVDLYREATSESPLGVDNFTARTLYLEGQAAFFIEAAFFRGFIQNDAPEEIRPNLKFTELPFEFVPASASNAIGIPAGLSEERKDAAWEFIRTVASESQQKNFVDVVGLQPSRIGVPIPSDQPEIQTLADLMAEAVPTVPNDAGVRVNFPRYLDAIINAITLIQTSDDSTESILSDLQTELQSIVDQ